MIYDFNEETLYFVLISLVLPIAVAFVTKRWSSRAVKSNVLLALASVNSVIFAAKDALASGSPFGATEWRQAVLGAIISFAIAATVHSSYLKPNQVTGSNGKIQSKYPNGVI